EALGDVRAGGFLAHRVQVLLAQDVLDRVKARIRRRGAHADPGWLGERLARHDLDRDALGLGAAFLLDPGLTHARASLSGSPRARRRSHRSISRFQARASASPPARYSRRGRSV